MGTKVDFLKFVCQKKGLRYVSGRGNPKSPIWIIGEAPGADEEAEGIAFVGQSGKELDREIEEAGLKQNDIYFSNPYKVRPPGNDLSMRSSLGIPDNVYLEAFEEELNEFKPSFIVPAGATPLSILCPDTVSKRDGAPRITSWRGSLLRSNKCNWPHYVIPTYHPAFILREYSERAISIFCLERVKEEFEFFKEHGRHQELPRRSFLDNPSYDDIISYLEDCAASRNPISHDIENPFYKRIQLPYSMNFSLSPQSAIAFNLWDLPVHQLNRVWRLIDKVLRSAKLIGQNYLNFDAAYQEESCGLRPNIGECHDTMTRHKILWPEFKHALEFQTVQYTREPYYKDESHDFNVTSEAGRRSLLTYGCKDAAVTYEIYEAQEVELRDRGLLNFYNEVEMPGARNFHCIQNRGIKVETTKLGELRTKLLKELTRICKDAEGFIGRPVFFDGDSAKEYQRVAKAAANGAIKKQGDTPVFNLGSPKQILEEFDRLKIYLPSEYGQKKTDEEAMQKSLAKTGHKLPKLILESRGLNKLKGTNIDATLRDAVLYTNVYTTGTVNGRRSSSMLWDDTPFCYGANIQNLPKHGKGIIKDFQSEYKQCLVARPGKIFLAADQVQAEDWIVQGIIKDQGGSPQGFQELLDGIDRHRKLATVIFKKSWDQCGKDSMERYLAKQTRHAGNYDMGAYRFAMHLAKGAFHVTDDYCEMLLFDFHNIDPGIKKIFHKYVQTKLEADRTLINPFGRIRIFFGLHPWRDNAKVFKEAYSTLPQSTVSDNTLQAVNFIESRRPGLITKEDHDALTLEIPDNVCSIHQGMELLEHSFDRKIRLEKGLEFHIPIEFELGYNLKDMKGVTYATITDILEQLWEKKQCNGMPRMAERVSV